MESKVPVFLINSHSISQVLSLGDSHVERQAVHAATSELKGQYYAYSSGRTLTHSKSVKFLDRPSMAQLQVQYRNCARIWDDDVTTHSSPILPTGATSIHPKKFLSSSRARRSP